MISQEDKDFLEANRGHYNTAVNAGFIQDLGQDIKSKMVEIIKRYFAPAYLTNLWCGPCIIDMVKYLYTQYDSMPVIKHETFPKHDKYEEARLDQIVANVEVSSHEPIELIVEEGVTYEVKSTPENGLSVDEVKDFIDDARGINNSEWNEITANVKSEDTVIINKSIGGYQPKTDTLDVSNPPQGGSGVPDKRGRKPKAK